MTTHTLTTPGASAPRPRALRRQAGFTIAEVMMATFVMTFGISSSIIAMKGGFKQIDVARGTTLAAQIIQSEMERIRMMPWNNSTTTDVDSIVELGTATDTVAPIPTGSPAGVEVFDGATYFSTSADVVGRYTITRTVTDDSTRPTEVKNIRVSVTWRSSDNRRHTRSFSAIYAKNGLYDYYYTIAHP